ncbi:uncharacterized protein [Diadema antillarum]|uniref:uncharacterized protein n=1 Tax=Diadema antillarum TaxID=105358 RepID=UPI003A8633A4
MSEAAKSDVRPEDSVSQAGSRASSRLRSKARRAALAAEVAALKEQQELERQELELRLRKAELTLQTKLRIAEAEEAVYDESDDEAVKLETVKLEPPEMVPVSTPLPRRDEPMASERGTSSDADRTFQYPVEQPMPSSSPVTTQIFQHLEEGQRQQRQLMETISLSNVDIMQFDGNPLKYFQFMRSFDSLIGDSTLDNNSKLLKLYNLCEGQAKSIIQCCLMMSPDEGYFKARHLLADRFGNNFVISEAWIKRVVEGPAIQSNSKQLRDFADQLKTCAETLRALGMLQEISNRREMVKIVERLPYHLRSRWLKLVKTIRDRGRSPHILDIVEFIAEAAEELNDPVFGSLLQSGTKDGRSFYQKSKDRPTPSSHRLP